MRLLAALTRHLKDRTIRCPCLNVVLPLLIGGSIYLGVRPQVLVMFEWGRAFHLQHPIEAWRDFLAPVVPLLPVWVSNSLPNGLWSYALTAYMRLLWVGTSRFHYLALCLAVMSLAVLPEVGQACEFVPGTFDIVDLLCISGGFTGLSGIFFFSSQRKISVRRV